jgi:serine/threonine-protein kinase
LPTGHSPPYVAGVAMVAVAPERMDLRGYELIEQLGSGGMGEVYRSCDPALERDLAVKVMKAAHRANAEVERRFLREARVTGSLQHPGIVPVHNLGRLPDGRLHYTMRLVHGRTFADILKAEAGQPEHWPALLTIFEKVCQAIAYAHSKRVIHRDLKPANFMVCRFGEVQVMDWGLAKLLAPDDDPATPEQPDDTGGTRIHTESADTPLDLSRSGREMGTPAYMPPEQALGEWDMVDEHADVFALGSILCEMLTGQPPYRGTDGAEVFRRAKRGDVAEALERLGHCGADAATAATAATAWAAASTTAGSQA